MDRRLIGALLVVAVLAVAILVPARQGLRTPGSPTMVAMPGDPAVGDCLLQPPADFWVGGMIGNAPAAPAPEITHNPLAPVFGPCGDGRVAGEVVAIVTATGPSDERQRQVGSSGVDCREAALGYAGLLRGDGRHAVAGELTVNPVSWRMSINLRGTWVLPSAVLQAMGRTWAACVVAPVSTHRYDGVIAGAYRDGKLPDAFGTCWDRPDANPGIQSVVCDQPHQAELISTGTVPARADTTAADIKRSCERLAAEVMRRADPTADGGITVRVSPETPDDQALWAPDQDIVCFVTPTEHSLAGTVVGLGDRPIPYAG